MKMVFPLEKLEQGRIYHSTGRQDCVTWDSHPLPIRPAQGGGQKRTREATGETDSQSKPEAKRAKQRESPAAKLAKLKQQGLKSLILPHSEKYRTKRILFGEGGSGFSHTICHVAGDTIPRTKFDTLRPGTWITDEIVNAFIVILRRRRPAGCKEMHVFKSFLYTKLMGYQSPRASEYNYNEVKTFTRGRGTEEGKVDIFEYNKLVFPLNIWSNTHWAMILALMKEKRLYYMDPKGEMGEMEEGMKHLDHVFRFLKDEHRDKKGYPLPHAGEWKKICVETAQHGKIPARGQLPKQGNNCDCGPFMLTFMMYLQAGRDKMDFTEFNVSHELRYYFAYFLLTEDDARGIPRLSGLAKSFPGEPVWGKEDNRKWTVGDWDDEPDDNVDETEDTGYIRWRGREVACNSEDEGPSPAPFSHRAKGGVVDITRARAESTGNEVLHPEVEVIHPKAEERSDEKGRRHQEKEEMARIKEQKPASTDSGSGKKSSLLTLTDDSDDDELDVLGVPSSQSFASFLKKYTDLQQAGNRAVRNGGPSFQTPHFRDPTGLKKSIEEATGGLDAPEGEPETWSSMYSIELTTEDSLLQGSLICRRLDHQQDNYPDIETVDGDLRFTLPPKKKDQKNPKDHFGSLAFQSGKTNMLVPIVGRLVLHANFVKFREQKFLFTERTQVSNYDEDFLYKRSALDFKQGAVLEKGALCLFSNNKADFKKEVYRSHFVQRTGCFHRLTKGMKTKEEYERLVTDKKGKQQQSASLVVAKYNRTLGSGGRSALFTEIEYNVMDEDLWDEHYKHLECPFDSVCKECLKNPPERCSCVKCQGSQLDKDAAQECVCKMCTTQVGFLQADQLGGKPKQTQGWSNAVGLFKFHWIFTRAFYYHLIEVRVRLIAYQKLFASSDVSVGAKENLFPFFWNFCHGHFGETRGKNPAVWIGRNVPQKYWKLIVKEFPKKDS